MPEFKNIHFNTVLKENIKIAVISDIDMGCGSWWPPMRFMADSEIPLIEFSKER
jgi:hypothetical protein